MTLLVVFLLVCLFGVVAFAAYEFAEAKRWKGAAASYEKQLTAASQTQAQLDEKFRALASEALHRNSQLFLDRSREEFRHLVEPVSQSLRRFEEQVQGIEKARIGAYEGMRAQVQALTDLQERVRQSTDQLKTALRSPIQRGRWGEMQLRRVVELAGMLEHCDFAEQETLFGETRQRPDLIVRLPNGCQVVVDSKVSLEAYLKAVESTDEPVRLSHLADHARQVKTHIKSLSGKAYWQQLPCSPEFVVAFLPLESLFSAALEHDPDLLAFAAANRVVIASPITLITLLLTVAHGWHQQGIADELKNVAETGAELYERLLRMSENFAKLGEALEKTVSTYNSTAHSLERRVFPSGRKLQKLHSASVGEIAEVREIDLAPRRIIPEPPRF